MDKNDIFESFSKLNVLIIGDVMLDSYSFGKVDRISPEAPVPILKLTHSEYRLGGAANVALNIKSMGATPTILSVVGSDLHGRDLTNLSIYSDIRTHFIVDKERKTTVKNRLISNTHHLLRVDSEDDFQINNNITEQMLRFVQSNISKYNVVIFEDYDKGVLHKNLIEELISICNVNNVPTLVDPKRRNFSYYKNVSILKPNLNEFKEGFSPSEDIYSSSSKMIEEMNLGGALITMSEKGIYINYKGVSFSEPAHVQEIFDVSGAGDTVSAVASLCLAINLNPKDIAVIANMAGGLVCQYPGVVPINKEELYNKLILEVS